jgi:hypothetical protein
MGVCRARFWRKVIGEGKTVCGRNGEMAEKDLAYKALAANKNEV